MFKLIVSGIIVLSGLHLVFKIIAKIFGRKNQLEILILSKNRLEDKLQKIKTKLYDCKDCKGSISSELSNINIELDKEAVMRRQAQEVRSFITDVNPLPSERTLLLRGSRKAIVFGISGDDSVVFKCKTHRKIRLKARGLYSRVNDSLTLINKIDKE